MLTWLASSYTPLARVALFDRGYNNCTMDIVSYIDSDYQTMHSIAFSHLSAASAHLAVQHQALYLRIVAE